MIEGMYSTEDLSSLSRRRKQPEIFETVQRAHLGNYLGNIDWLKRRKDLRKAARSKFDEFLIDPALRVARINASSIRIASAKPKPDWLEDRVWALIYKMNFPMLSGETGARIKFKHEKKELTNQVDVVAFDNDCVISIECKSSKSRQKSAHLQNYLAKFSLVRTRIRDIVDNQFKNEIKRATVQIMWVWDIIPTEEDQARAAELGILLLDEKDLDYYEELVKHLGEAAKYQFLADCMRGTTVNGLSIRIPALTAQMGKHTCYMFAIKPSYLLKLAYVSHRAKGKAADIDAYQRMVSKPRLKSIRQYIEGNNIFPTNIVINFEGKRTCEFESGVKEGDEAAASYGYLKLKPSYGCAWIIDGQHRLFGYSGTSRVDTSYLSVLAFENLPPSKQAQLFIDINHKQKSVSSNLLSELFAELHWGSEDERLQAKAIVSKLVQALDQQSDSPFSGRVKLADQKRTNKRCISFLALYGAINKPGMFIEKVAISYGPLWAGDIDKTFSRAMLVVNSWFISISNEVSDWWELGAEHGGGLAMNDGVAVCMGVFRSVSKHLRNQGTSLVGLGANDLVNIFSPFATALGKYFGSLNVEDRKRFRDGTRGTQGVAYYRRICESHLNTVFPDFNPPELEDFLKQAEAQTKTETRNSIDKIEETLREFIKAKLVTLHGNEKDAWWFEGVSFNTREVPMTTYNKAQGKGHPYDYVNLIDYREIALYNWKTFHNLLARGDVGNSEVRTKWLVELNEIRRIASHASRGISPTIEQLEFVREIENWLLESVKNDES